MEENVVKPKPRWRWRMWLIHLVISLGIVVNAMAFMQARGMCCYERPTARTTYLSRLNGWGRASVLICGPTVRRQLNVKTPRDFGMTFAEKRFPGSRGIQLEAWQVPGDGRKPVVLMFPGYGASKDTLLRAGGRVSRDGE
jgi:hypothetical protein